VPQAQPVDHREMPQLFHKVGAMYAFRSGSDSEALTFSRLPQTPPVSHTVFFYCGFHISHVSSLIIRFFFFVPRWGKNDLFRVRRIVGSFFMGFVFLRVWPVRVRYGDLELFRDLPSWFAEFSCLVSVILVRLLPTGISLSPSPFCKFESGRPCSCVPSLFFFHLNLFSVHPPLNFD